MEYASAKKMINSTTYFADNNVFMTIANSRFSALESGRRRFAGLNFGTLY